jgi:hypothetical protein
VRISFLNLYNLKKQSEKRRFFKIKCKLKKIESYDQNFKSTHFKLIFKKSATGYNIIIAGKVEKET